MIETKKTNYGYILGLAIVSAIAGLLFGFDIGIISGALPFIAKTFNIISGKASHLSYLLFGFIPVSGTFLQEFIVAAVPGGALIGAIISAKFARNLGRRRSIILTGVLFFFGTLMAVLSPSADLLIISRLIMGFAVGVSATIVPMYLAEVSPPSIRGATIFLYQMAVTVGIFSSAIINYIFATIPNPSWRWMFAIGLIPSAFLSIGMYMLPSSPRWLVRRGEMKLAEEALKKLRNTDDVALELADIKDSLQHAEHGLKVLFSKRFRPLVIIAFGLFVFQQLTGINTIFYYAPTIFENAGFHGVQGAITAALATTGINVLATLVGIWLVDSLGRRKLLSIGLTGIVICMFIMGAAYHHWFPNEHWVLLVGVLLFITCFAFSIGGIPYILMSEVFPLNVKTVGMAVASCANWGFNWLVASTFLTLVDGIGIGNADWLYAFFSVLALIFVLTLVPETKNRSLEDITRNLYRDVPMRHLGDPVTEDGGQRTEDRKYV